MAVSIQKSVPIFRIFAVAWAVEPYVGSLGSAVDREHHFDEGWSAYFPVSRPV